MDVFINDCLFQDYLSIRHFDDQEKLHNSIRNLSELFNSIKSKRLEYSDNISLKFYASSIIIDHFFKLISNKTIEDYFRIQLSKVNPIFWDANSIQSQERQYYLFDHTTFPPSNYDIEKTSLAEAYEYKYQYDKSVLVINFPESVFSKSKSLLVISVRRYSTGQLTINCVDNSELLNEWIDQNIDKNMFFYDYNSNEPPTDLQTCLRSKIRFEEKTEVADNGRRIFIDKDSKYKWYVDNAHHGRKSHIEVFNNSGLQFIGEASLEGIVTPMKENPHNKTKSEKRKEKRKLRR